MPTVKAPPHRWEELGALLQKIRVELSPRYKDRSVFARDREVNERMVGDLERADRKSYRDTSLRAVSIAYGLDPDAIEQFVTGRARELASATQSADADPQPASAPAWDGEITGPEGVVGAGEVLMWRDTPTGRLYRLADAEDSRLHGEYEFPPGETPGDVIDDLRRMLGLHRTIIGELDSRMDRRRGVQR